MQTISTEEWNLLRNLARRARVTPERVTALEQRWRDDAGRFGAPYTLVIGLPKSIELLIARWLGPEVARVLMEAGMHPLVIGPEPDKVQPPVGRWAELRHPNPTWPGHLLVVRTPEPLSADLEAALASLRLVDQVIFATRSSQPLSHQERLVVRSLRALAATIRALIVALPDDDYGADEISELITYAVAQMEANGFGDRCLGAAVWFTETSVQHPNALSRVEEIFALGGNSAEIGRLTMLREALNDLLDDLEGTPAAPAGVEIPEKDVEDAIGQFNDYLSGLGQRTMQLAQNGEFQDSGQVRRFLLDTLQSWTSGYSLAATFLNYIEKVRPGTKAALLAEAEPALSSVELALPVTPQPRPPTQPGDHSESRVAGWVSQLKRFGAAILGGFLCYVALYFLITPVVKPWLVLLLCNFASITTAICCYLFLPRRAKKPALSPPEASPQPGAGRISTVPALRGWTQAEQQLSTWFSNQMRNAALSVAQECERLRSRLNLPKVAHNDYSRDQAEY